MATGPSSSQSPYLVGLEPNVRFVSIATVGDAIGIKPNGTAYRMVGIPDGLGALDNGDNTFTILQNHELGAGSGIVREHGSTGAFVSRLIVDKTSLAVLSAEDAIKTVALYNPATDSFFNGTTAFARFCSADLADPSAYLNQASGLGTSARIYLTGEETGAEGRAFAVVASGPEQGTAYELAHLGNFSYENSLASPFVQDKTVVISTDDVNEGQLYVYVGQKQATGNVVERAGLTGGDLFGIRVEGLTLETNAAAASGRFSLQEMGLAGDVSDMTGAQLDAESDAEGVTGFLRPEDGQWDPNNPNIFYFVTTASNETNSRLYKLTFDSITNPQAGGKIEALLDGSEGHKMLDNMTVSDEGLLILQEDPGSSSRLARVWSYDPKTDKLTEIGQHDPARFGSPPTAPFNTNEESSGVIDVTSILGDADTKAYLLNVQAHYSVADPELVEGGQLLAMFVDTPTDGGAGNDAINGGAGKDKLKGFAGNDTMRGGSEDDALFGGDGNDSIEGGSGDDGLFGDAGNDTIDGGTGKDLIKAGRGNDRVDGGAGDDRIHGGDGDDILLGGAGGDFINGDAGADQLIGGAGRDGFEGGAGADRFIFLSASDSSVDSRDFIDDFSRTEGDKIDLSAIDAVAGGADDPFTIVNAFTGIAGQLVLKSNAKLGAVYVSADINGDGKGDFGFTVRNVSTLGAEDFNL